MYQLKKMLTSDPVIVFIYTTYKPFYGFKKKLRKKEKLGKVV